MAQKRSREEKYSKLNISLETNLIDMGILSNRQALSIENRLKEGLISPHSPSSLLSVREGSKTCTMQSSESCELILTIPLLSYYVVSENCT
jgi:hypothetical protein